MEPKAFNALPQEERQRIEGEIEKLQGELQDVVKLIPGWATEHRDALRELNREITAQTLDQPIDRVNARFGTIPGIGSYLEEMREDLLDNVHALLQFETAGNTAGPRSEEHTSELQSLMRISYAVFCLKKKKT